MDFTGFHRLLLAIDVVFGGLLGYLLTLVFGSWSFFTAAISFVHVSGYLWLIPGFILVVCSFGLFLAQRVGSVVLRVVGPFFRLWLFPGVSVVDVAGGFFAVLFGWWGMAYGLFWSFFVRFGLVVADSVPQPWRFTFLFGFFSWLVTLTVVPIVIFVFLFSCRRLSGAARYGCSLLLPVAAAVFRLALQITRAIPILFFGETWGELTTRWHWWLAVRPSLPGDNDNHGPLPDTAGFEVLGNVAPVSVTSHLAKGRLRRRARWVRAAEAVLGGSSGVVGKFCRGRWVPDLPSSKWTGAQNYLLTTIPHGARFLGGGVETVKGDGEAEAGLYLVVELRDGSTETLFPSLLGHLRQYALFRERTLDLALGLRARGVEWCKARGMRPWVIDIAVCSAVGRAFMPSSHGVAVERQINALLVEPSLLSTA